MQNFQKISKQENYSNLRLKYDPNLKKMSIRINVSNQKGFLWDIKGKYQHYYISLSLDSRKILNFVGFFNSFQKYLDIQTLRVEHHICGILTGTLPQVGQQNIFLGLPLMLLPEEVVLLVKNSLSLLPFLPSFLPC